MLLPQTRPWRLGRPHNDVCCLGSVSVFSIRPLDTFLSETRLKIAEIPAPVVPGAQHIVHVRGGAVQLHGLAAHLGVTHDTPITSSQPHLRHQVGRRPHADAPAVPGVGGPAHPLRPAPAGLPGDVPEAAARPPHLLAALAVLHQLGAHAVSPVVDTLVVSVSRACKKHSED